MAEGRVWFGKLHQFSATLPSAHRMDDDEPSPDALSHLTVLPLPPLASSTVHGITLLEARPPAIDRVARDFGIALKNLYGSLLLWSHGGVPLSCVNSAFGRVRSTTAAFQAACLANRLGGADELRGHVDVMCALALTCMVRRVRLNAL